MPWALLVDLVLVVVFAAIGRASHAEQRRRRCARDCGPLPGRNARGVGTGADAVARLGRWRSAPAYRWLSTLALGMVLRVLFGGSTAFSFILVAGAALAILLLGWRWLAAWWARRTGFAS